MKKENNQGKYSQAKLHKSVCFQRSTIKKKKAMVIETFQGFSLLQVLRKEERIWTQTGRGAQGKAL